jgi:hypothetical protein
MIVVNGHYKACTRCGGFSTRQHGFYTSGGRLDSWCKECRRGLAAANRKKPGYRDRARVYEQRRRDKAHADPAKFAEFRERAAAAERRYRARRSARQRQDVRANARIAYRLRVQRETGRETFKALPVKPLKGNVRVPVANRSRKLAAAPLLPPMRRCVRINGHVPAAALMGVDDSLLSKLLAGRVRYITMATADRIAIGLGLALPLVYPDL